MENITKDKVLELADQLEREWSDDALNYDTALNTAAGLRRLHQEVEELSSENIRLRNLVKDLSDWNDSLKERLSYREAYPDNFVKHLDPLTHEQRLDVLTKFEKHKMKWDDSAVLIDLVEAAHGIK